MILNGEGVDGVGKSTACSLLAERMGAVLVPTPPAAYLKNRDEVDRHASDEDHYRFFLRGVQEASREVICLMRAGKSVVLDRYWPTTVAYHRAMGLDARLEDFGNIVQPDWTIYFEAEAEVRLQRMTCRGLTAGDVRNINRLPRVLVEYERLLASIEHVIRIDTSRISPEVVVERILDHLR